MDALPLFPGLWLVPVALALLFAFSTGFRDSSTIVATVVSTGTLSPSAAFGLCGLFEFLGALLVGHAIITRMGSVVSSAALSTVRPEIVPVLTCALVSALGWVLVSGWRAWPTSNSQALIGGLAGTTYVLRDAGRPVSAVTLQVFFVLIASPILGLLVSSAVTWALRFVGGWMTTGARPPAKALHVLGCLTVSAAHGSNYGQIATALVAAAMVGTGSLATGHAPVGVRLSVAAALTAGVLFGGQRVLRNLGFRFYRIREVQGLGAQLAASGTILSCLAAGFPASTTQVVSGCIVGAGVAKNPRSVRWLIVREVVASWLIAIPATAILSGLAARIYLHWGK